MKKHLLICILLLSTWAKADFDQAMQWYDAQSYDQAFDEFTRLAQLGNHRAQYNLAVMYLHGQHVAADPVQAYAWAQLAQTPKHPEFKTLINTLEAQFSTAEQQAAQQAANDLSIQYGETAIHLKLAPIQYQSDTTAKQKKSPYTLKIIEHKAPRYPKTALNERIQGWVTVGFDVYPDGTVRHPYVIDAYPPNVFEQVSLDAVQKFKFDLQFKKDAQAEPISVRQTIEYSLAKMANSSKLRELYDDRLKQLKSLASEGFGYAQYLYAIAASSNLLNEHHKISPEELNEWLLKAATNGHSDAQYLLGINILRGLGSQAEKQKGVNWIVQAASQGHARAARMAHDLLTRYAHLNNTDLPAEHWLQQAAMSGDADAQIDFAAHLVKQDHATTADIELARQLLEDHKKQRDPSVDWYQASALVLAAEGDSKQAEKHAKKAHKLAKKLGWDLSL